MDIRQLEYFEAVSRLGSFTQAAREHHVSQPTVTVAMRKLEEELGLALFERTPHQTHLTAEGVCFLERARAILAEVQQTLQQVDDLRRDKKQTLRLGIPPFLGSWILPIIFTRYVERYPNVELVVRDLGTHEVVDALLKDHLDLGLVVLDESMAMFDSARVSKGELSLLIPKGHPFEALEQVPFERLADENIIMYGPGTFITTRILEEFTRHAISPRVVHTPQQLTTILNLVSCGAGISFVLDDASALIQDSSILLTRPLAPTIAYQAGLVWRRDKYMIDAARDFLNYFKA